MTLEAQIDTTCPEGTALWKALDALATIERELGEVRENLYHKKVDGHFLTWEEQVARWTEYTEEYRTYRNQFRT
jgi:hypothetical protein